MVGAENAAHRVVLGDEDEGFECHETLQARLVYYENATLRFHVSNLTLL